MITLRCTQKLLQRLGAKPEAARTAPTNALGNWYASLISGYLALRCNRIVKVQA
jgi:hypothetical protein